MKILHIFPFTHFINDYLDGFKENVENESHVFWLYGGSRHLLEERNIDIQDKKNVVWDVVAFENFDKFYEKCDLFVLQCIPENLGLLKLIWTCYLRERKPYIIVPWGRELCGTSNLYNGEANRTVVNEIDEFKRMLIKHCSYITGIKPKKYEDNIKFPEIMEKRFAFINVLNGVHISYANFTADYAYVSCREKINLMVGHRGTYTGGHKSVLNFLEKHFNEISSIICPLSYGDDKYINEIDKLGRKKFSYKWHPVFEWISREKWIDFLKENVDVAVFNNSTSEGANTIYTMICMGKKVFINPMNGECATLKRIGAIYYEWNSSVQMDDLLTPMDLSVATHNNKVICEFFSLIMFRKRWHQLFKECISEYQLPEISIVLPVYNGERYLRESLDSILAQTFTNWELIIVDDCSTDSTLDIVYEYASKDCRIRVIHNEVNKKLPVSLNIGFSVAKGEYYTWTSDDNAYLPDALQVMHDALVMNETVPMVVADMEIMNSNGKSIGQICAYNQEMMYWDNYVGACFMYRKAVVERIGEYNASRFLVEDYDYWLRVQKYCGEIFRIPKVLYRYRVHEQSLSSKRMNEVRCFRIELLMGYFPEIMQKTSAGKEHIARLYFEGWMNGLDMSSYFQIFLEYIPELAKIQITRNINEMPEDLPIVLFGAGESGKQALHCFGNKVRLFIDNDERKHGCEIGGIPVCSFDDYCKRNQEDNIVVSVDYYYVYAIIRQLCEANVRRIGIFCSKVVNTQDEIIKQC